MGRFDRRATRKIKRRKAQRKKKDRAKRKVKATKAERAERKPAKSKKKPAA